eukprot:symbB.v1.2.019845.t1/scaffold1644.1/size164340/15
MPSKSMVSMDAFPESKRGRNAANNKVKAAYGQRRIGKGNEDFAVGSQPTASMIEKLGGCNRGTVSSPLWLHSL